MNKDIRIKSIAVTKDNLESVKDMILSINKKDISILEQWENRISDCEIMLGFYSV